MDMYTASYMMMFLVFLGLDLGLSDTTTTTTTDPDTTDPDTTDPDTTDPDTNDGSGDEDGDGTPDGEDNDPFDPDSPLYNADDYTRTIQGTPDQDTLSAGDEEDLAWFLNSGDDDLEGSDGNDYAEGNGGNDDLNLRGGNDIVLGGGGNDTIDGGIGFDQIIGGVGNDQLDGNGGKDTLYGAEGDDTVVGGSEADLLYGGDGADFLSGLSETGANGGNASRIDGVDTLFGGDGDDTLLMGAGDSGTGGAGADTFQLDHSRHDFTDVTVISDYTAADKIELYYEAEQDEDGNDIAPTVTVAPNDAGTAGVILFNGQIVAQVSGGQALTTADIRIVKL